MDRHGRKVVDWRGKPDFNNSRRVVAVRELRVSELNKAEYGAYMKKL